MSDLQIARNQFEAEWRRLRTSIETEVGLSRQMELGLGCNSHIACGGSCPWICLE